MSRRPEVAAGVADVSMDGETVLVTGSTGGIGRETALALGRLGATVLVHGRDAQRGRAVVDRLEGVGTEARFLAADFASLSAVEDLAGNVRDVVGDLDVLVNNAGGIVGEPRTTDDGVETTFAVNHLAPFLLTLCLLGAMPDDGRVVTVASALHERARIDFEDLRTPPEDYAPLSYYGRSKLANVLFTRELARRLDERGSGIVANCLHPGAVPGSAITRNYPAVVRAAVGLVGALPGLEERVFDSLSGAAETPVYLAVSPEVAAVSGEYFVDCQPARPSHAARNDRTARRLWQVSADLAGTTPELRLDD
jgi:NAD(P)-dependent dehydrogenase (short-subunit alcohol dehydrogenase family)